MPIPLVVGPNMNIQEDQVSYSAVCKRIIIANLDCHDLNVSALAPPITHHTPNIVCSYRLKQ